MDNGDYIGILYSLLGQIPRRERAAHWSSTRGDPLERRARKGKQDMNTEGKLWEKQLRDAVRTAERKRDDGYYRARWLQQRIMNAASDEEFEDLLDELHEQEEKNHTLALKVISARGCLIAWEFDHKN